MHRLLAAEAWRTFTLFRRYPSEALVGVLTLGVMFGLFLLGVQYVGLPAETFGSRLDAVIVGYVLWSLTLMTLSDAGYGVQMEAQMGTLEQVFQSPFGPIRILFARTLASIGLYLILNVLVLAVLLLLTGRTLHFSPLIALPLLTLLLAATGLGFALAGLAVVFKRIDQVLQVAQYALLFFVISPVETWKGTLRILGTAIPLAPSAGIVRDISARNTPPALSDLAIAAGNGLVWLVVGVLLYVLLDRSARRKGQLGAY
jgi:ABC-2 type transport system permease protein